MVKNRGGENGMILPGGENGISPAQVSLVKIDLFLPFLIETLSMMVSAKPESPEPHTIPIFGLNSVFDMFNFVRI